MASDVPNTTPPAVRCWCAITPSGAIIPWLCGTDRERVLDDIRKARTNWLVIPVTITPDADDGT